LSHSPLLGIPLVTSDWLSPLLPLSVLGLYSHNLAALTLLIDTITLDLAVIEKEVPDFINIVIADTSSLKFDFAWGLDIVESLLEHEVVRLHDLLSKLFTNLLFILL
jgi:hypothetical protein